MAITLTSPITGAAQTGFTTPTYSLVTDWSASSNPTKIYAITALGGTQAGVTTHSATSPFTVAFTRPTAYKQVGVANPSTGVIYNVPNNTLRIAVKKGVTPAVGQTIRTAHGNVELVIPAGSDTYDPSNIRAMISALIGALNQVSAGLGDTAVTGIL